MSSTTTSPSQTAGSRSRHRQRRLIALNRFGLGARIGEVEALRDPQEWLLGQLEPASLKLAGEADLPSGEELERRAAEARTALRSRRREAAETEEPDGERSDGRPALPRSLASFRETAGEEMDVVLRQRVRSETPFVERLVAFWSNHLCVSFAGKPRVAPWAGHYERAAIRPHVLGRFRDMVTASAKHPAMLLYLDNAQSLGPRSPAARFAERRGRDRGLNENYARELLELHTLGVDGGYAQTDVEQLARILTGWTVAALEPRGAPRPERGARRSAVPPGAGGFGGRRRFGAGEDRGGLGRGLGGRRLDEEQRQGLFAFRPLLHEPGGKTVLGITYQESGVEEGERAIRDLCGRETTAAFVAAKLVRHFVADDPPPRAVERIARVFHDSGGDLLAVSRELVQLPEAWEPAHRKFRSPQDWVVAILRALRSTDVPEPLTATLRELRHALWAPSAPKGYGDEVRDWADPASLMSRAELARTVARHLPLRGLTPAGLLDVIDAEPGDALATLLADQSIPTDERIALAFGGPAFQWR
jgi:uncharacterized protein (DUF1800 family)